MTVGGTASPASVAVQRRVEWIDTDAAGHHHYSLVFRLAELAERALHQRLGIAEQTFGQIPRVQVNAAFHGIARFGDLLTTVIEVQRVGRTSVAYDVTVRDERERTLAEVAVVTVLLDRPGGVPTPWPERFRSLLESAGPQRAEQLAVEM